MTHQIGISEAKTRFSYLLDEVEHGMEFIITRYGKPVAKIVPYKQRTVTAAKKHGVPVLR